MFIHIINLVPQKPLLIHMKNCIIISFLFLLSYTGNAQHVYSFRYKIDANELYKSAKETKNKDPHAIYGISLMRKHYYATVYMNCISNNQYLECEYDLKEFLKGYSISHDTNSIKNYNSDLSGFITNEELSFAPKSNTLKYLYNRQTGVRYNVVNDTIGSQSVHKVRRESFLKTGITKTINNWLCTKWIPKDTSISNKVVIWISDEVPKEVSPDIFSNDFDGGVVEIEWINGRFNILTEYKKLDSIYNFNMKALPLDKSQPGKEYDLLRNTLLENDTMEVIE